jgi:hypothetical protein
VGEDLSQLDIQVVAQLQPYRLTASRIEDLILQGAACPAA